MNRDIFLNEKSISQITNLVHLIAKQKIKIEMLIDISYFQMIDFIYSGEDGFGNIYQSLVKNLCQGKCKI